MALHSYYLLRSGQVKHPMKENRITVQSKGRTVLNFLFFMIKPFLSSYPSRFILCCQTSYPSRFKLCPLTYCPSRFRLCSLTSCPSRFRLCSRTSYHSRFRLCSLSLSLTSNPSIFRLCSLSNFLSFEITLRLPILRDSSFAL